jgi:hypothetical protein
MRKTGSAQSNSCPRIDPEARLYSADIIGYLVGYAHLSNTRSLALRDASAYELLFSFSTPEEKDQFLDLVRLVPVDTLRKPKWASVWLRNSERSKH